MSVNLRQTLRFVLSAVIAMMTVLVSSRALADDSSWVGRKIMTKEPGVWIGHTGSEFPRLGFGFLQRHVNVAELTDLTYTVLKEQDGWLQVRHRSTQDWLPKDKAILLVDAFAYFDVQVRANSQDAFALAHRGRAWYEQRGYEKALADLNEAIRLDPDRAAWYGGRGMIYDRLGEYDRAIRDYDQSLRRDPADAQAYNNRGLAFRAKKDNAQAINDFTQAIRLDSGWADAYFNRGNVHKAKKDFSSAIKDYDQAIRLDPTWGTAYFNRANAHHASKEYEQAISDYRQVIRLDREDADAFSNLAWLLATCPDKKLRDGRQAIEYAMTACDLTSWKASYFLATLAAACAENGDFDQAVRWQKRALESSQYEKDEGKDARQRLALFEGRQPYHED